MRERLVAANHRKIFIALGAIAAFLFVGAPACNVYNGGGLAEEFATMRLSPLLCRDGARVVVVKELSQDLPGWNGGSFNRITLFRGSSSEYVNGTDENDPNAVVPLLAHEDVHFALGDPAAVWPGYQELPTTYPPATSYDVVTVPWRDDQLLDVGQKVMGQRYTHWVLNIGFDPVRGVLGPEEIIRPTDSFFDPLSVIPGGAFGPYNFSVWARPIPEIGEGGVSNEAEMQAENCWLFPTNVDVSATPGATDFPINPTSTFAYAEVRSTPPFDATTIDAGSVRVGKSKTIGHYLTDFDQDGDLDLIVAWNPSSAGLTCTGGSTFTEVKVTGKYAGGRPFTGTHGIPLTHCP